MSRIPIPHPTVDALRGHLDRLRQVARTQPLLQVNPARRDDLAAALAAAAARVLPGPLPLDGSLALVAASQTPPLAVHWQQGVAAVERHFAESMPDARQAQLAAATFMAAGLLACAGILAAIGVAAPGRSVSVAPVTAVVDRMVETRAESAEIAHAVESRPVPAAGPAGTPAGPPGTAPAAPEAAPRPVTIPAERGPLPVGKGMWLWLPERCEGGDANAIVARATSVGLTHLYVRTGSSRMGFYAQDFLNRLLPVAHANGIRVYGWDFPYLEDWSADVRRAVAAITYTTPDGHRIDGFSADIETAREGVSISAAAATAYGHHLRKAVGTGYPLIATVPRPNPLLVTYPMREVVASFDAIAPMVYWMGRDPGTDVVAAMQTLSQYGKPVIPVGQAYDGAPEGGPPGVPPRGSILRFMGEAERAGAVSVSFWSWQHASQEAWDAIRDSSWFVLPAGTPWSLHPAQLRAYQTLLSSLGFYVPFSGVWDVRITEAVLAYQRAAGLPQTGLLDDETRLTLMTPFAPPVRPIS